MRLSTLCACTLPFNSRTVLLILDRNIDLVPLLSHGWTYQALVSDCLEMKLNRVTVASPQKKAYDLDAKDFFWAKNAANPFPQVAEDIDTELNRYKQDAAEITRSTGVSDVNDITQLCDSVSSFFSSILKLKLCGTVTSLRMRRILRLQSRNSQS